MEPNISIVRTLNQYIYDAPGVLEENGPSSVMRDFSGLWGSRTEFRDKSALYFYDHSEFFGVLYHLNNIILRLRGNCIFPININ